MTNRAFLWSYAVITWLYIIGSVMLPMITDNIAVLLAFTANMLIAFMAISMIRAKTIGKSSWYGLGIFVPIYQMFVLVNLGK